MSVTVRKTGVAPVLWRILTLVSRVGRNLYTILVLGLFQKSPAN